jgi:hypothetical protein
MHLAFSGLMSVKDSPFLFFFLLLFPFSGCAVEDGGLCGRGGSTIHLPALILMKRAECSGRKRRREKKREAR